MTIRAAKFADTPAIEAIIRRTHARSKYAHRSGVNDKALNAAVLGMIAGQAQSGPQATHVTVCEQKGQVVGFMASTLARIYSVGDKLCASDVFLINEGNSVGDTSKMIDRYIEWASANPKVIEIGLSWSDTIHGQSSVARHFVRKGFTVSGETYTLRLDAQQAEAA